MIPIKDYNPTRRPAIVTLIIIGINVAVYFLVQPAGHATFFARGSDQSTQEVFFDLRHAAIPCEVTQGRPLTDGEIVRTYQDGDQTACETHPTTPEHYPNKNVYVAILYSMFLHGSLLHIGGNMLFLWVFGNNIEDRMGPGWYAIFYLVGGFVAAMAHILAQPMSTVPVIGASGAIAAVMGAYLVLFPNVRIRTLIFAIIVFFVDVSAKWLLLFWLATQFFINPNEGVAWVAHVGGFVFGAIVAFLLRGRLRPTPAPTYPRV
jgi:membrane associated rhomboid family serine protease